MCFCSYHLLLPSLNLLLLVSPFLHFKCVLTWWRLIYQVNILVRILSKIIVKWVLSKKWCRLLRVFLHNLGIFTLDVQKPFNLFPGSLLCTRGLRLLRLSMFYKLQWSGADREEVAIKTQPAPWSWAINRETHSVMGTVAQYTYCNQNVEFCCYICYRTFLRSHTCLLSLSSFLIIIP